MRKPRFGSLFSGIGGFDLGFERAGMECAWQVEIDAKASLVLERHWPGVLNIGDVRNVARETVEPVDLICGGFPCQDVSVAGRRAGLAGERSGLWFEFHRVLEDLKPEWVVVENVPGLLSSNGGRDFAVILRGLVELRYGVCWRILDAQHFGVPQRRRRVFIVGSLGDGRSAEVLFERESGTGDFETGGEERQVTAPLSASGAGTSRTGNQRTEHEMIIAHTLRESAAKHSFRGDGSDNIIPAVSSKWSKGTGGPSGDEVLNLITVHLAQTSSNGHGIIQDGTVHTLDGSGGDAVVAAFLPGQSAGAGTIGYAEELAPTLKGANSGTNQIPAVLPTLSTKNEVASSSTQRERWYEDSAALFGVVRRLTPTECERLQGFPDNWTEGQADSARYRQLGNAVAVPCAEWLGRRLMEAIAVGAA